MSAHFSIHDSGDALQIYVRKEVSAFLRVACGLFAGWFVWFVIGTGLQNPWRTVVAVFVGICVLALFREMTALLTVTESEFFVEQRRRGESSLQASKIYRLEHQEHETGGQGIYAITLTGEPVLLPHVDAEQAAEIIAAIKKKFPQLAEMWRKSEAAAVRSGDRT